MPRVNCCTLGLIQFELHSCLVLVSNLEYERSQNSSQLLHHLMEAEKFLVAAGLCLKMEPPSSPYGGLASTISGNLAELQQYIDRVKMMQQMAPM